MGIDVGYDVVVVGSGAAGLAAALSAARGGARVAVLERSEVFGGTSSVSGGSIWIPNNAYEKPAGLADSREEALTYLRSVCLGFAEEAMLERYVDASNEMVAFLVANTNVRIEANLDHPDYQPGLPGARPGGRTLQFGLYDTNRLGAFKDSIRRGFTASPITRIESDDRRLNRKVDYDLPSLLAERAKAGIVGLGMALIGDLLEACLGSGVQLFLRTRARHLLREGHRVAGVVAEREAESARFGAAAGIVLAAGGYEWNQALVDAFLGVPMVAPGSPPWNEGDALLMAMEVGAALGNMSGAWWNVMYAIPGDTYEDRPLYRPTSDARGLPGLIMVNRRGRRFVNEAMNYNDLPKAMKAFDPVAYEFPNTPAHLVIDAAFRRSHGFASVRPDSPDPAWLLKGETLPELARRAGIDPEGLAAQVAEFNGDAARGVDTAFHRGESSYDRYRGAPGEAPLRPLGPGPFYAVPVYLGCFGTNGGPVIDVNGQVLDIDRRPIPGLYACGNSAASVFGPAYPGAGGTLGPGMTFGYLAGRHMTRRPGDEGRASERPEAITAR